MDYIVQPFDTLTKIAKQFGTTVENLVSWNSIPDPNLIYPKQVLRVTAPGGGTVSGGTVAVPTPAPTEVATPTEVVTTDVVDDTLFSDPAESISSEPTSVPSGSSAPAIHTVTIPFGVNKVLYTPTGYEIVDNPLQGNSIDVNKTSTVYDTVSLTQAQYESYQEGIVYAGYIDGKVSAWSPSTLLMAKPAILITVLGSQYANCADVENGDLTIDQGIAWAKQNPGRMLYMSRSTFESAGSALDGIYCWVADWTNTPHMVEGAVGTQWTSGTNYDTSIFYSDYLNV